MEVTALGGGHSIWLRPSFACDARPQIEVSIDYVVVQP
jgi:hypothetical protein